MRRLLVLSALVVAFGCEGGRIGGEIAPRAPACGDGICGEGEDCAACEDDCGSCLATCGNATCDPNESCSACPSDCGTCGPCGDAICEGTESCATCEPDCGVCNASCGDGTCDASETCGTCAADCGACNATCGDGACDGGETCGSCAADCGACGPTCGDGTCDASESCNTCSADCGACPVCGDGTCNGDENCATCEGDCGSCTWDPDLEATEDALLVLMNELRAAGATCGGQAYPAVPALAMHEDLREAARLHSLDMGEQNYFDHTSLDGRSPWDRIRDAGYPGSGAAENIAAGNASAQATFNQWLNSPGHCRNMMTRNANEVGIGHAEVPGSRYRHYWTQAFGRR